MAAASTEIRPACVVDTSTIGSTTMDTKMRGGCNRFHHKQRTVDQVPENLAPSEEVGVRMSTIVFNVYMLNK